MKKNEQLANSNLVFGILGAAFSWFPILGIIFSSIGLKKDKEYNANGYDRSVKQIIGSSLSIAGLAESLLVLCLIFFLIFCIVILIIVLGNLPVDYDSFAHFIPHIG